jgi:ATP-dependent DNA helicase RecG
LRVADLALWLPDRLELELPMFSIIPDEILQKLKSTYGDAIDLLGKDELTILSTCAIEGDVSNTRLQYMIDLHRTDITKVLQEMCKQGYLLSDSKGRWTTYHLNTTYLDSISIVGSVNYDLSENNVDTSENNRDTSQSSEKRSYIRKEELENMILSICNTDFKTLEELAVGIAKNPKYVKNSIIPKLIESGKLERLYPKIINHPHQAYKAKE